jgi:hypothetical protein
MKKRSGEINEFIEKFRRSHPDPDIFTSGQCANFAVALCVILQSANIPSNLTIMIRHDVDADDLSDICASTFSHCIVEAEGELFDIEGSNADVRWESQYDDTPDKWNQISKFEYIDIDFKEKGLVQSYRELSQIAGTYRADVDHNKMSAIFVDLRKAAEECYLVPMQPQITVEFAA